MAPGVSEVLMHQRKFQVQYRMDIACGAGLRHSRVGRRERRVSWGKNQSRSGGTGEAMLHYILFLVCNKIARGDLRSIIDGLGKRE